MDRRVTQDDIIYFVVTDRFCGRNKQSIDPSDASIHGGTLDGILEKLDYLIELGVTTIWVTPVYENIQDHGDSEPYHYYWPQSFERLDRRLLDGTRLPESVDMRTFGKFVDLCETRGMKVVLDMVVNHAGYGAQGRFDTGWFNIGADQHPSPQFRKEREIYEWTRDLIHLRKKNAALKYGTTITLWSDDLVYAFLRIAADDVTLVIIINGYERMTHPIRLHLNGATIPQRVIDMIGNGLKHWKTGQRLTVQNGKVALAVDGKAIDIFCRDCP